MLPWDLNKGYESVIKVSYNMQGQMLEYSWKSKNVWWWRLAYRKHPFKKRIQKGHFFYLKNHLLKKSLHVSLKIC
jgi:hypothetical protein